MPDYKDIRFLESISNLREILHRNSGTQLSAERGNQISVCLEQGRLLSEAAQNVGWEIKPLLVYYGMTGFAKAISLWREFGKLESLPQRHGLRDVSDSTLIEEMKVKIEGDGTFQRLNNSCSKLEKLIFHDSKDKLRISVPTTESAFLDGKEITLREILARIPGLEDLYRQTFRTEPELLQCSHFSLNHSNKQMVEFTVHNPPLFTEMAMLSQCIEGLRRRFPFLRHWRVRYAAPTMGVTFTNLAIDNNAEIPPYSSHRDPGHFELATQIMIDPSSGKSQLIPPISFSVKELGDHCQPVRGNLTPHFIESTCVIGAWNGLFLSEVSLYYLGMFLLSSLLRYRPYIWANAIARRSFPEKPLDDHALALIEAFIDLSLTVFPQATVIAINEPFP